MHSRVADLVSDLASIAFIVSLISDLAAKQDVIINGGLPQAKMSELVSALVAVVSSSFFYKRPRNEVGYDTRRRTSIIEGG